MFRSLSSKLIIIVLSIVAIVLIVNLISKRSTLIQKHETAAKKEGEKVVEMVKLYIKSTSKEVLSIASVLSENEDVKKAYEVYYASNNFDSASALLKSKILPVIKSVSLKIGETPQIHFHLPPAQSFCRCWTDKAGDDLSAFRYSILDVSATHKPIKGIEVGRGGFSVRGIAPILEEESGKYLGSVEAFLPFDRILDKLHEEISGNSESFALLISADKANVLNKNIAGTDVSSMSFNNFILLKQDPGFKIKNLTNEDFDFFNKDKIKYKIIGDKIYVISPVADYNGNIAGVFAVQIDLSQQVAQLQNEVRKFMVLAIIILLLIAAVLYFFIKKSVGEPTRKIATNLQKIADGELVSELKVTSDDEIGVIYSSFNKFVNRIQKITEFAKKIGKGELDTSIEVSEKDILGKALLEMKHNLEKAKKEEEQRKEEDRKRNWIATGLAKFAEILRQNNDDLEKLGDEILQNLVHYVGAIQGGLFIYDEDSQELYLLSAYAYNRKKFMQKNIKLGEGQVGTCAIEKEKIFLTDVPDDYLTITSGLGEANPRNILLVPLKLEDKVFGVIELASFEVFEPHKVEFIEKVAESIAAVINSVSINIKTKELLEQSKQQAEKLAAQEEEMRQNLEEMQATQESLNAAKKEAERVKSYLDKLTTPVIAIDTEFNVVYANNAAVETFLVNTMQEALRSKCYKMFSNPDCKTENCRLAMAMKHQKAFFGKTVFKGREIVYMGVPMFDETGKVVGAVEQIIDMEDLSKYI